jgi:hypothetical protein
VKSDLQELFNTAYTGLRSQGFQKSIKMTTGVLPSFEQSPNSDSYHTELCALRGLNGLKCAIGYIIPDELYQADLEVIGLEFVLKRINVDPVITRALRFLQCAHDDSTSPEDMKRRLADYAAEFKLAVPEAKHYE